MAWVENVARSIAGFCYVHPDPWEINAAAVAMNPDAANMTHDMSEAGFCICADAGKLIRTQYA